MLSFPFSYFRAFDSIIGFCKLLFSIPILLLLLLTWELNRLSWLGIISYMFILCSIFLVLLLSSPLSGSSRLKGFSWLRETNSPFYRELENLFEYLFSRLLTLFYFYGILLKSDLTSSKFNFLLFLGISLLYYLGSLNYYWAPTL